MMQHPIQTANVALIIVGILLFLGGPYIIYRTVVTVKRKEPPLKKRPTFGEIINVIIGLLFFFAGILFVINNLRGNPLA